jgi:hypothetical protein
MLNKPESFPKGYHLKKIPLDSSLRGLVQQENWNEVDQCFSKLTVPGGMIFTMLQEFHSFSKIETMISIRDGKNEWEEDGIWHDDGSRVFAFSLSITINPQEIEGGALELRRKNETHFELIATPEFGTAILFLTGIHGFEHRTRQVIKGKRMMLVGWCS